MVSTDTAALLRDLAAEVADCRAADPTLDGAIDGRPAAVVCRPESPAGVATALAIAARHRAAVIPRGGGTKLNLGLPPRAAIVLLALDGLNQIGDYSPADLTVSTQAGVRWAVLQERLAAERQQIPLDPPAADRATVGGVLATNSYGPSRIGYGAARDYLIGVAVAHPDGVLSKAGGKVVKNVAGYDLNKLYIGSLGTLGVIVEATWKLLPLPLISQTVLAGLGDVSDATTIATRVVRAGLQPRAAQVLDPAAARRVLATDPGPAAACWLALRFSGWPERVRRQIEDTRRLAAEQQPSGLAVLLDKDDATLWSQIVDWPGQTAAASPAGVRSKITVRPTDLPDLWRAVAGAGLGAVELSGQAALGALWVAAEAGDPAKLAVSLGNLRAWAAARGGALIVEAAPPDLKARFDVWGDPGDGLPIMRRLKDLLDPDHILNPGRFVAGI